jgi:type 1 glutamine amidotransferase
MNTRKVLLVIVSCFVAISAFGAESMTYLDFKGQSGPGKGKRIVLIAGDEEYRSEESLPMLAKILSQRHGFDCTVLFSLDPTGTYIDPNNQKSITNPQAIAKADLIIIQTRYRQWSPEEYQYLADFLNAGKPIIGLRTSTHAFTGSGKTGDFKWDDFGLKILGEKWVNHHGRHKVEGTRGVIEQANANHPILNGVKDVFALSDVYTVANLNEKQSTVLMRGAVTATLEPASKAIDGAKNNPMMPVAWVREYTAPNGAAKGKAFMTTMGASVDFKNEDLRRLVVNASYFLTGLNVASKADVTLVDPYEPTMYGFNNAPDFYKSRNMKVADLALGKSASTGPGATAVNAAAEKPRIVGTWKLVSTKYGDAPEHTPYNGPSTRNKIINPTHFVWVEVEPSSHKLLSSAGGKYILTGNSYTETIDFAGSGMEEYAGKPQKFTVRVEGDKLTQSGELSDGLKIEEVWERVK